MNVTIIGMGVIIIGMLVVLAVMESYLIRYRDSAHHYERRVDDVQRAHNRLQIAHDMSMDIAHQDAEVQRKAIREQSERISRLEETMKRKNAEIIKLKSKRREDNAE